MAQIIDGKHVAEVTRAEAARIVERVAGGRRHARDWRSCSSATTPPRTPTCA